MVHGVRALLCGLLAIAALAALPAAAHALTLTADHPERGWIRLRVSGAGSGPVDLAEETAAGAKPITRLTPSAGRATLRHAGIWRCDRYARRFIASTTGADGSPQTATADVRTPSCRHRLLLRVRVLKHGRTRRVQVRLVDRFKVGDVRPRVCVRRPGRRDACRTVRIAPGREQALVSYGARAAGLWTVGLRTAWKQDARASVYIRPSRRLRVLATGDSMIQILDSFLKRRLGQRRMKVRSDARISTGLSKPFLLNWPNHAKRQVRSLRPDVTVVFIGANDGFPFGGTDCCGDAWVDAYAARVRSMMSAYSRNGRGLVYWITLPAPQPAQWRPIYPAVNRAIRQAASSFAGQARVVDISKVISPGYRFTTSISWHGRRQTVRQGDGVHLSVAGASIAEALVERALRQDGVL
jgi:lysophospholipase L1-like esterase